MLEVAVISTWLVIAPMTHFHEFNSYFSGVFVLKLQAFGAKLDHASNFAPKACSLSAKTPEKWLLNSWKCVIGAITSHVDMAATANVKRGEVEVEKER